MPWNKLLRTTFGFAIALTVIGCSSSGSSGVRPFPVVEGQRVAIQVPAGPGPAQYNTVWVRKYGPPGAGHVLVLVPGSPSGQGNYNAIAPALVRAVSDLEVWTLDRRENGLEDGSVFAMNDPDLALDYYLLGRKVHGRRFTPIADKDAGFVREWGINLVFSDLHAVVQAARDGGRRRVILGGHSMGAVQTPTYAVWDFDGEPGYRDLEALVMIDGAPFEAFKEMLAGTAFDQPWQTVEEAQAGLQQFAKQSPFGFAGTPLPLPLWVVGVLPELACQYALKDPNDPALLQILGPALLPLPKVPWLPVTNEAFFGLVSSEGSTASFNVRTGQLAPTGLPRPWVNGTFGNVPSMCATFVAEPGNGMAWFYPVRLDVDLFLATPYLRRTAVTDYLQMRPFHLSTLDLPVFVFETSLSNGGVIASAQRMVAASSIRHAEMHCDQAMGHLDPLADFPDQNLFFQKVVPFLQGVVSGHLSTPVGNHCPPAGP
jgi:hypothetical protein